MENVNEKQIDWLFKERGYIKYSGMKDICEWSVLKETVVML